MLRLIKAQENQGDLEYLQSDSDASPDIAYNYIFMVDLALVTF